MADDDPSAPEPESPLSFKEKLRSTFCFFCCFHRHHHRIKPKLVRSSSLQHTRPSSNSSSSNSLDLPHLKEKCTNFISKIGRHRRRHHSADFHYDALSYALNFEDDTALENGDRSGGDFRNFSSRLPISPPPSDKIDSHLNTVPNSHLLMNL